MPGEGVLRALKHTWVTLEPLHAPMAVMGGIAVSVWKHVRATRDVDLLVQLGPEEGDNLLQTLQGAGMRPKRQTPFVDLGPSRVLQVLYEPPGVFLDFE